MKNSKKLLVFLIALLALVMVLASCDGFGDLFGGDTDDSTGSSVSSTTGSSNKAPGGTTNSSNNTGTSEDVPGGEDEPKDPAHEHEWGEWITIIEPVCKYGFKARECTSCGYTEMKIMQPEHSYVDYEDKEPTCSEKGWKPYQLCELCGDNNYEELPATGHNPVWETEVEATCTGNGSEVYMCQNCLMILDRRDIPAHGHEVVDGACIHCGLAEIKVVVKYEYADGAKAADDYELTLWTGDSYYVESPDIEGYMPDAPVVSGVATEGLEIKVIYSPVSIQSIVRIDSVDLGNVAYNTPFADLALPSTVKGYTSTGREVALTAFWSAASYSATTYGAQTISGVAVANYGYVISCSNVIEANLTITTNVITAINPMDLGKLPINTPYAGLGLPSTASVTTSTGAIYYVPVVWDAYSYDSSVPGEHTITGALNLEDGFVLADGVENLATIKFELSEKMYGTADIVFIIDTTGSMYNEIQNVRNNISRFADRLESEGVSVRWALLEYRDITCDGVDSTRVVYCGSSEWYIDVDAYKNSIAGLHVTGGGDLPETVVDALKASTYLESREAAKAFYIVVTDANYKSNNSYGVSGMPEMIDELVEKEIVASVVTKTNYYNDYRSLTDSTNGILANIDGDFASELWRLCDLITEEVIYGDVVRIEIVTKPSKTAYVSGDYFDGTGMIVRAYYESGLSREVTGYGVYPYGALQVTDTSVEINYRGKTATVEITVEKADIPVTGIVISDSEITLRVGQTATVTATVLPSNATNSGFVWSTLNPNVAVVENGVIKAIAAGQTYITATTLDGGFTASVRVKVEPKQVDVAGIYTDIGAAAIVVGDSIYVNAVVLPENATNKDVIWSSSNSSVAIVENGLITGISEGTTTITVATADGGYEAKVFVVVLEQTGTVEGVVRDDVTNGTISGVSVKLYKDSTLVVSTTTGSDGRYVIESLAYGEYYVEFSKSGYETLSFYVEIDESWTNGSVGLTPSSMYGTISGRVYKSGTSTVLSGVSVKLYINGTYVTSTTTGSNGIYTFSDVAYGSYVITYDLSGYVSASRNYTLNQYSTLVDNTYLAVDSSTLPGYATGYAKDATTDNGISGITVYVRSGNGNTTGTVLHTLTTGTNGYYTTQSLSAGNYTLQFVDNRSVSTKYITGYINVTITGNTTSSNNNVSLSQPVAADTMRIVLTWGAQSRDLDSHILVKDGSNKYHIYYSNKTQSGSGASLDVDITEGYGPETVTVSLKENGKYVYYIHNFSSSSGVSIGNSDAKIKIYIGTEVYEFTAPSGTGNYWKVFSYDAATGEFTFHNQIVSSEPAI